MYDGIEYRGFGQEIVEELAKVCRGSGMEWSDQRISPDTDAGRYADDP